MNGIMNKRDPIIPLPPPNIRLLSSSLATTAVDTLSWLIFYGAFAKVYSR